jgi:ABC-2 type transport system permease protein
MPELARHGLRVERRSLVAWAVGLVFVVLLYLVFYPSIKSNADAYRKAIEGLPEALRAFAGGNDPVSPAGYLQGQFFASLGAILFFVFTIGRGARGIAGDEQAGMLELVLAAPVSRTRLVLERALALGIETALLGLVTWLALWLLDPLFDLGSVGAGNLAAATASLALGAYVLGLLALAAGALAGQRAVALGIGAAAASAAFLFPTLAPLSDALTAQRAVSPGWQAFGYKPVVEGADWGALGVLCAEGAVLLALAVWGFRRRDLR